jgi:hypothetical protein
MTVFIKPCRIIDPLNELARGINPELPTGNWIEIESSIQIEDADIPLMAIIIHSADTKVEEWLLRPLDFEMARDWVFDTSIIAKADKPRLMWLLNTMEEDSELYMHLSW